jgi:hypothetical protein
MDLPAANGVDSRALQDYCARPTSINPARRHTLEYFLQIVRVFSINFGAPVAEGSPPAQLGSYSTDMYPLNPAPAKILPTRSISTCVPSLK